ncbi:tripartite tricarboxylate transporter permease [Mesorhizobium sp. 8]|uniref:tripartite tricarboxylate transporter permease n=1 Tax=Mesorhizobium sp. 8 TaxID=2584466 RepID=UPI001FEE68B4|nr:tripartite tricarboxylate transporter permease [Mesorhizobium sp. 8]
MTKMSWIGDSPTFASRDFVSHVMRHFRNHVAIISKRERMSNEILRIDANFDSQVPSLGRPIFSMPWSGAFVTVMALMIGALIAHGVAPGPMPASGKPESFRGVIASMWVGNVMLVVLNLPPVGIWVKLLSVPFEYLYPAILVPCAIGTCTLSATLFDVWPLIGFEALGYIFLKLGCEPASLIMSVILGPMMEEIFRCAMFLARGDFTNFVTRPVSLGLLVLSLVALVAVSMPAIGKVREQAFEE